VARTVLTITSQLFDDPEQEVSIRENLPIRTLIAEARSEFNLPDGNYTLAVQSSGKVLDAEKTLEQVGIQTGAVLMLTRERRMQQLAPAAPLSARQAITSKAEAFITEDSSGKNFEITFQPAIIGRMDANNPEHAELLAVDLGNLEGSKSVSRAHARITEQKGTYFVEPMAEHNPLYLEGSAVRFGEKRVLATGDKIRLGNFTLTFNIR
jgi:hypothetical protein